TRGVRAAASWRLTNTVRRLDAPLPSLPLTDARRTRAADNRHSREREARRRESSRALDLGGGCPLCASLGGHDGEVGDLCRRAVRLPYWLHREAFRLLPALVPVPHVRVRGFDVAAEAIGIEQRRAAVVCAQLRCEGPRRSWRGRQLDGQSLVVA